jgi:hypothetical protein
MVRKWLILNGGADRDRTDDLLNAIQALSQLSYSPKVFRPSELLNGYKQTEEYVR